MRTLSLLAVLVGVIAIAARPAPAAFVTGCCACLDSEEATTAQAAPAITAVFCGLVEGQGFPAFVQRCEDAGGSSNQCITPQPGQTCGEALLAEENITCPANSGAPLASPWAMTALAAALGALGVATARRRR